MLTARRIYQKRLPPMGCHLALEEIGRAKFARAPDPPAELPEVEVGRGGILIATRCPDSGEVDLEVWAGDPGKPSADWKVVFDGDLETERHGFDARTATASAFHLDARPGTYPLRVEIRRDDNGLIDGVRFIFPESTALDGKALY